MPTAAEPSRRLRATKTTKVPKITRSYLFFLVTFVILVTFVAAAVGSLQSDYPIAAVPASAVTLTDKFWAPKLETNRRVTIPHILQENETTGRVDNFRKAARQMPGAYS